MNKIILRKNHLRLLMLSLMLSLSMAITVSAGGGDYLVTSGDYIIVFNDADPHRAGIVAYTGNASHVTVPGTLSGFEITELWEAFQNNTTLTSITLPDSITAIRDDAFSGCTNLTSVHLGSALNVIATAVFNECTSLTSLTLPDTLEYIGPYAFANTDSLKKLTIPASVKVMPYALLDHFFDELPDLIDAVIYVYSGSEAHKQVLEYGNPFVLIDDKPSYTYHNLSALYSDSGYVTATTSTPYAGEKVTFAVHPYDYSWISAIYVYTPSGQVVDFDYDSYKNEYSFIQPADDVVISVEYGFSGYDVTTSSTSNGTLSIGNTSPQAGERVVIKASPSSGYRVGSVTATTSFGYTIPVGYDSVNNEYAFIQPYSGVNVSATFSNNSGTSYVPFVIPNNNGSAWVSNTNPSAGDVVQITLNPADGYKALKVSVTSSTGGIIPCTKISETLYQYIQPDSRAVIEVFYYYTTHVTQYFDDIAATNTYAPYVAYVLDRGWMTGTTSSTFEPATTITRGMAAVIFAHLSQETIPTATSSSFWDCYTGQWYSDAVEWCKSRNIVSGYENGSFGLNDPITKEQLATMMYGFSQHYGLSTYAYYPEFICSFVDADETLDYAFNPMTWSLSYNYLRGSETNVLSPQSPVNRGEMARMLSQFFEGTTNYQSIADNGWSPVVQPEYVNISLSA